VTTPLLVDADWLQEHRTDPSLRLFDCTGALVPDRHATIRSVSGRSRYDEGHVPGADYLDLDAELSDPAGRFVYTAPSAERFAAAMSRHGVAEGTRVVLYGKDRVGWATRVWWLLRRFGFDDAAVLDGGWEAWVGGGRPVSRAPASYPPARFEARPRPHLIATSAEVAAAIGTDGACIVDARPRDLHTGEAEVHFGRPGHIPGSVNLPYLELLDSRSGTFLPTAELRDRLGRAGLLGARRVVGYCSGGIGATAVAFALALVGHDDASVYDGSMLEWSSNRSLPVARGG
jgi:thiosulfate/3-mercaptopyruvate sulfurtransferase